MSSISSKISKLEQIFDLDDIVDIKPDKSYIQRYYKINKLPYAIFHSRNNLIHMGVSKSGKFDPADLHYFTDQIHTFIETQKSKSVLELGSGRGANSYYLAKKFPKVKFVGIDFSDAQLHFAKGYSKEVDNLEFIKGDYHDLSIISDGSIDLCFIIEALCYSDKPNMLFQEVRRILKPSGLFYIADGYLKKQRNEMSEIETQVKELIEIGMAVNDIKQYDEQNSIILQSGFKLLYEEDVSKEILPTLRRFERLAKYYLHLGVLTKFFNKILPDKFLFNLFSGYLLPESIKSGLASYMISVYTKK